MNFIPDDSFMAGLNGVFAAFDNVKEALADGVILNYVFTVACVLVILYYLYQFFFAVRTYVEPDDPEALAESEAKLKERAVNETMNFICTACDVDTHNGESITHYQPNLDTIVVEINGGDRDFVYTADLNKMEYRCVFTKFIVDSSGVRAVIVKRKVKMNKDNYMPDFRVLGNICAEFQAEINAEYTLLEFMQEIAQFAHDPALDEFTDEEKENILFYVAQSLANLFRKKKHRRNLQLAQAYCDLMAYICCSGKKDKMKQYLQQQMAATDQAVGNTENNEEA